MSLSELVTVLECVKETPKAYLLKMYGKDRMHGKDIEFETWWPKSSIQYVPGDKDAEVPKWLLTKKLEELYGDSAMVEIY